MCGPQLLLGDWGTSRLRLWLCDVSGEGTPAILGATEGPGVAHTGDFGAAFREAVARLPQHPPRTRALLAGMAGSNVGWKETPYVPCPAGWSELATGAAALTAGDHEVTILPGVSCTNRFGYHDVMRGEETQLIGLSRIEALSDRPALVCLPGTHTKWATVDACGIRTFTTTVQGELFDLLQRHSILLPRSSSRGALHQKVDWSTFSAALDLIRSHGDLGLMHALFSTRSMNLAGKVADDHVTSWLTGLLIGAEVREACRANSEGPGMPIRIIGEETLTLLYARAMAHFDLDARRYAGRDCIVQGLAETSRSLQSEQCHGP